MESEGENDPEMETRPPKTDKRNVGFSRKSQYEEEHEAIEELPRMMPDAFESLDWHIRLSLLEVPDKYKDFFKIVCDERLPVRAMVGAKGPSNDLDCPCCGDDLETTMHCLWECRHAKAVWSMSPFSSLVVRLFSPTFREFSRHVTRVLKDDRNVSLFLFICLSLWEARNDHVQHHIAPSLVDDSDRAAAILNKALLLHEMSSSWEKYKLPIPLIADLDTSGYSQWRPPPNGWLKMNVEALRSEHMTAMAAVVRDADGRFLDAFSSSYKPAATYLLVAKASALWRALVWAQTAATTFLFEQKTCTRKHQQKVVVELNSNLIVNCLAERELRDELRDELRKPLEYCLAIASRFPTMLFANVSARENRLDYCLASLAIHRERVGSWIAMDAPDRLVEAVIGDLAD